MSNALSHFCVDVLFICCDQLILVIFYSVTLFPRASDSLFSIDIFLSLKMHSLYTAVAVEVHSLPLMEAELRCCHEDLH